MTKPAPMTDAYQIIARGPRADAEAAAEAIDADIALEGATYSILEEDEDKNLWRIDAFPTTEDEADGLMRVLGDYPTLEAYAERIIDDGWQSNNAEIRFDKPMSGVYDVWVGVYGGGTARADLLVTEVP